MFYAPRLLILVVSCQQSRSFSTFTLRLFVVEQFRKTAGEHLFPDLKTIKNVDGSQKVNLAAELTHFFSVWFRIIS